MPDTIRNQAALLGLFSDNTGGLITAQNIRDFVVSVALDANVVHLAGTETVSGAKTFSTLPILSSLTGLVKASSGAISAATNGTDYLAPRADGTIAPAALPFPGSNPIKSANIVGAWEAESLALDNNAAITTWPDSGPNGYNLTQSTGFPVYQSFASETGLPAVRLPGSSNLINASMTGNLGAFTVIAVLTPESRGSGTSVPVGFGISPLMGVQLAAGQVQFFTNGGGTPGGAQFDYRYATNSPGPTVITLRSNGTNWFLGTNNQEYTLATPIASSASYTGVSIGGYYSGGSTFQGLVHAVYVFNSALSPTTLASYTKFLHAKYNVKLNMDTRKPSILFDSNSLGTGFQASKNSKEPFEVAMEMIGRGNVEYRNVSSSGMKSLTIATRVASVTGPMIAGAQKSLVIPWEGTNDTAQANVSGMFTTWVAQGCDVLATTSISRSAIDATLLTTNNPYVRTNWRTWGCKGLIDFAQHYRLGALGAYANTTYYHADATHLLDPGYYIVGNIIYNNWLIYQYPNGGGPDPQLPGYTTSATPVVIKSWFPIAGDGLYTLRVDAVANRVDSGTEDVIINNVVYKIRIASGVVTVTSPTVTPVYSGGTSTATIAIVQSALNSGGFDIQAIGEASKAFAWKFTLKLTTSANA